MMSESPKSTDWHRRPSGATGPCPICGLPDSYHVAQHRAAPRAVQGKTQWQRRYRSAEGWVITGIGRPGPSMRNHSNSPPKPKTVAEANERALADKRVGPKEETRKLAVRLATAMAYGQTESQAAKAAEISTARLGQLRRYYPGLWGAAYEKAMVDVLRVVREGIGTEAVLTDPDTWLQMARHAEKWTAERGEALFPAVNGEETLPQFYERYYAPACMSPSSSPGYKLLMEILMRRWRYIIGDLPLSKISIATLALFRDVLAKSRGLQPHMRMSVNTVRSYMTHVQSVLDKAGPRGRHNRDGAGILADPPYIKRPRKELPPRTIVSEQQFVDVLNAAVGMDWPCIGGTKPAAWWRSLLLLVWATGIRAGTVRQLTWQHVNFQSKCLELPAAILKQRRPLVVPIDDTVIAHLKKLPHYSQADLVFVFPVSRRGDWRRSFYGNLHKLENLAGIPRPQHFGLHALRRTLATRLWEIKPGAARLMLGHTAEAVTQQHYVKPDEIIMRAVRALPQLAFAAADE